MFKRMLLTLSFVAATSVAGLSMSAKAMAHDCGYGGYGGYGYRAAYYPPVYAPYQSYGYGTRVAYYPNYYPPVSYVNFDRGYRHHHHHDHSGLSFTFGF